MKSLYRVGQQPVFLQFLISVNLHLKQKGLLSLTNKEKALITSLK
jgi:hypothetical protein